MSVCLNNLVETRPLSGALTDGLTRAASLLLTEFGLEHGEMGIILADNAYLQQLNRTYRGLDEPTDVLSFALIEPAELEQARLAEAHEELLLGDVYISLERAEEQARESGRDPHREILLLAVHGILHLLGYDHADSSGQAAMQDKEAAVLSRIG